MDKQRDGEEALHSRDFESGAGSSRTRRSRTRCATSAQRSACTGQIAGGFSRAGRGVSRTCGPGIFGSQIDERYLSCGPRAVGRCSTGRSRTSRAEGSGQSTSRSRGRRRDVHERHPRRGSVSSGRRRGSGNVDNRYPGGRASAGREGRGCGRASTRGRKASEARGQNGCRCRGDSHSGRRGSALRSRDVESRP
jgi:hypothetical protein